MWFIISLLFITTLLVWLLSKPFYWKKKKIPYLIPLPFFGSFRPSFQYGVIDHFYEFNKKFPGHRFYGMHFFTRPALYIKDTKLIQRILVTDFEYFTSHSMYSNQDRDAAGGNLFHINGQQWEEMREKVNKYFTPSKVKAMLKYVDNTMPKMNDVIDKNIAEEEPVEMTELLLRTTVDVITQAIFGVTSSAYQDENSVFCKMYCDIFKNQFTCKLFLSVLSPKLYDLLKLTVFGKDLNITIANIVKKTIEYRRKENIYQQDFLQGMMELLEDDCKKEVEYFPDGSRVPRYDLDTLIAQGIILFIGGVENTQLSMAFFLYEVSRNPVIQNRCRAEINSVVKEGNLVTVEDLTELIYMQATIHETLRLHSPFIMVNRECTKEYKIPESDVTIEKGTFILMSPKAAHMDEKNFPEPKIFRPERFLEEKSKTGNYFPFGRGPRICIGMHFANSELKLVLARLLQRYEFFICSKTQVPLKYAKFRFLTMPEKGIWLGIRRLYNTSANND